MKHLPTAILILICLAVSVFCQTVTVTPVIDTVLRGRPTETAQTITSIRADSRLEVLLQRDEWLLVQGPNHVGWINKSVTKEMSGATSPGAASKPATLSSTAPAIVTSTITATTAGKCKDGTYTSSPTKDGACAGHGGLEIWYADAYTSKVPDAPTSSPSSGPLTTGPRGGCYYINKNGKKTYVDRGRCQ